MYIHTRKHTNLYNSFHLRPDILGHDFPATMFDRVQVECLKQGTFASTKWTPRILTTDARTGTITISRRGHPENVFYHSLRPTTVQPWPHFCRDVFEDNFYSWKTKLTLCILGTTAPVPDFTMREVALAGIPLPPSAAVEAMQLVQYSHQQHQQPHVTQLVRTLDPSAPGDVSVGRAKCERAGRSTVWVLRFSSRVSYDVAVHMLREVLHVDFSGDLKSGQQRSHLRRNQ